LFYNNEPEKAWHQAETALALARRSPTLKTTPFLEKTAFYAMQGHSAEFGYDEAKRLSFLVKDFQHQAIAFEAAGFNEQMVASMDQALETAVKWVQETDDKIGPVIYRTLVNYLSLGLSHPKVFADRSAKLLDKTCRGALEVFAQSPYRPPAVIAQQAKLTLLMGSLSQSRARSR
jgi:hypothetical protein